MSNLSSQWASLGIAFYTDAEIVSPEEALISLIESGEFPEDKKMMGIALMWLKEYSLLVHVERLKIMAKDLNAYQLAILGGIAAKVAKSGDLRWKSIERMVQNKNSNNIRFELGDLESFLRIKGLDAEFARFGLSVAMLVPEDKKKLLRREQVLTGNIWLRNRVLFGANVRADIATLIQLGKVKTGYEAAKLAKCSTTAAYRNFSSLIEAGWPALVALRCHPQRDRPQSVSDY